MSAVFYDRERRRIWVVEQRLHHGTAGSVAAAVGLAVLRGRLRVAVAIVGFAAMAHDWRDYRKWFARDVRVMTSEAHSDPDPC